MAGVAFKVKLGDGTEMGPLDVQMLRSWYQQGLVTRESKVRRNGTKSWQRLFEVVDVQSWGASGSTSSREAEADDDDDFGGDDAQTWRTYTASALLFLVAAGAGYFAYYPSRWLSSLRGAPWREIALGHVVLGLLLVRGWEPMRKVVRVLVFLLTFSLFAVAAPVLMQGFHWRPVAVLVSAWLMGSGLFFFLAGRALPWKSVALCLFWILAGAAGVGALGFVPSDVATAEAAEESAAAAKAAAAATWSPSATAVSRDLPMLTPRAAELVVSYGLDRPEAAFRLSYLLAANGVGRLSPAEAKELGELTTALYAPLPPANRKRLDGYMGRVRALQVTQPQEDREMSALVREAVLQFPDPQRARYQALYEKALGLPR
jgi:uncharacterized protein DUF4339